MVSSQGSPSVNLDTVPIIIHNHHHHLNYSETNCSLAYNIAFPKSSITTRQRDTSKSSTPAGGRSFFCGQNIKFSFSNSDRARFLGHSKTKSPPIRGLTSKIPAGRHGEKAGRLNDVPGKEYQVSRAKATCRNDMTWITQSLKCRNNLIDTNACMRMHAWTSLTIKIDLSKSISNNRNCQDSWTPFPVTEPQIVPSLLSL